MIENIPSLSNLIRTLQKVPYLASKNLYQVTDYFLQLDPEQLEHFCKTLLQAKNGVMRCNVCFYWVEKGGSCQFCTAADRVQTLVCVVERWQEVLSIEKTRAYDGVYHVLGGVISPLDGVGPENLSIQALIDRVEKHAIDEIILATNQTPEGEATAAFIARALKGKQVKVSCLARGLPVGSSIGNADRLTVYKALSERRPF